MKRAVVSLLIVVWTAFHCGCAQAAPGTPQKPDFTAIDKRVEALLSRMTLEEKIGQMTLFSSDYDVTGPTIRSQYLNDIKAGRVGAIFNALTPDFTRKLQRMAVEETRLKIPLLFGYDVIHGYRTIFPIPLGESCSWDLAVMERSAHIAATEAAADGVHWTFAPMVDIARDPRWGRVAEGAGEDPWLGSLIARARVRGFQGTDLAATDRVLACAKHYVAYGAAQAGRDYNTVDVSRRELLSTYLPPFHAAVDEGCATIMTAFNEVDGTPMTANDDLVTGVLRKQWHFSGFVVTDYTAINEMINHGNVSDQADAAQKAALAGIDMDMQSAAYLDHLADEVKAGRVPEKIIDDAVRRILRYKFARGLFEDPYRFCDNARARAVTLTPANRAACRDAGRRSIVLLKNSGVLPLRQGLKVALIGPLADNRADMKGPWAGQGRPEDCVTVLEGLRNKGVSFVTARGCDVLGGDRGGFAAAVDAARKSDVVVALMGEHENMSGEASSRANPDLPGVQRDLLKALKATGKPVVLVLMNGRPLTIQWEQDNLDAVVEAWFLGSEAGNALADVLMGDYNPSGHLVISFPRVVGQIPIYYNHKNTGRPLDPNNYYTSRYLDEPNDPLYPFGWGLSYTTFHYSPLTLSSESMQPNGTLTVQVTLSNTGRRDGEAVAQLYIRDLVGSVTRPVRELRGFQKVFLRRGESKKLTFTLTARDLAFYRKDMSYGAEAGDFKVWVGPNCASGSEGRFRLTQSVTIAE